jgi:hypothetical protein
MAQATGSATSIRSRANSSGAGWVLAWRKPGSSSTLTLYAEPLSAAATVPTSPTVTRTVTGVPLTCTGTGTCSLSVSLDSSASAVRASAGRINTRTIPRVLARRVFRLRAGHRSRLRFALSAKGAPALSRNRSLRAHLVVTESLGLTAARSRSTAARSRFTVPALNSYGVGGFRRPPS